MSSSEIETNHLSSNEISLVAHNVNVKYQTRRIIRNKKSKNPLERIGLKPTNVITHAARDVSLVAKRGEMIGVIGRNGSGKSTLLRAFAGLEPLSSGTVYVRSQPVFLGVAPALVPDRTGMENIELGCYALGLKRAEALDAIPFVANLTKLDDALNDPIETYSSGMRARLGFCISAALPKSDILIIDETLSTGDAAFKDRSKEIMDSVLKRSGTIFIVSHSADFIESTCNRAVWIKDGAILGDGDPKWILRRYRKSTFAFNKGEFEREENYYSEVHERYEAPNLDVLS